MKKGFKGFDKNFVCRDMQYKVGETYEIPKDKKLKCCPQSEDEAGLHFCENPMDVFGYYAPAESKFAEVESEGDSKQDNEDSKVSARKLHIRAEISLNGLLKAGVKFILDRVKWDEAPATNTGNYSAATNTGNYSAATNTGNYSAATNTGYQSAATNTGYQSAATNTGNYSAATVEGLESVAISLGIEGRAKANKGSWIVLAEWKQDEQYNWHRIDVRSFFVDGDTVKADTFYKLVDGALIEVK
ncbi:MAG: hypothetical protein J7599_07615 [Niabella sp.]|nr:hypothetical protein [Niabella sp.]